MSVTVCIAAPHTLAGSGNAAHLWIFINWALSLRAIGARVVRLEDVSCMTAGSMRDIETLLTNFRDRFRPLDLADDLVLRLSMTMRRYPFRSAALPISEMFYRQTC
jgi:hypothetical protein